MPRRCPCSATVTARANATRAGQRDGAAWRDAVELVDDTRARLALNVSEELALEALAYRLES